MLKHFILNKWTLVLLAGVISAILYVSGFAQTAGVMLSSVLSFIIMKKAYKDEQAVGTAYLAGIMAGLAGLAWIYALTIIPLVLSYMYGPVQARSFRMTVALLIGAATPFWIYLPFYLLPYLPTFNI